MSRRTRIIRLLAAAPIVVMGMGVAVPTAAAGPISDVVGDLALGSSSPGTSAHTDGELLFHILSNTLYPAEMTTAVTEGADVNHCLYLPGFPVQPVPLRGWMGGRYEGRFAAYANFELCNDVRTQTRIFIKAQGQRVAIVDITVDNGTITADCGPVDGVHAFCAKEDAQDYGWFYSEPLLRIFN